MKAGILKIFESTLVNWSYTEEERLAYEAFAKIYGDDVARMIINSGNWVKAGGAYIPNFITGKE